MKPEVAHYLASSYIYCRAIIIKIAWYQQKNTHTDQWNGIESPDEKTHVCGQFFKLYLLIMLLQLSHSPPHSTPSCPPPPSHIPPLQFMSMGHTYKFFGFYISYTILTLPLSIFYLAFMLLILCTFPLLSPSHSPIDNPPCDLHLYGSVPVLVVCLVCSCFSFRCGC